MAECQIVGIARHDKSRPASRHNGAPRRSASNAGRHLRLVHWGLRYRRPPGCEGASGSVERVENSSSHMICGQCKTENPDGLKFCNECGDAFKGQFACCGFQYATAAKFCGECGARIIAQSAPSAENSGEVPIRLADSQASENIEG